MSAGFLENAEMNEETQKLWIELDEAEENGAFYLASKPVQGRPYCAKDNVPMQGIF
jgi:hypothetical protein